MTPEQSKQAAVDAAMAKMNEGLAELVDIMADPGEPEVVEMAMVFFESRGMNDAGLFERRMYIPLELSRSRSKNLGVFMLLKDEIEHYLACPHEPEGA